MSVNNGGPAFPLPMIPSDRDRGYTNVKHHGMDLRDYFAGQALMQMAFMCGESKSAKEAACQVAEQAYSYADAMLEARSK